MLTRKIVLLFLVKVHMIVVFECSCVYDEWVMNGSGKKGIGITLYDFFLDFLLINILAVLEEILRKKASLI